MMKNNNMGDISREIRDSLDILNLPVLVSLKDIKARYRLLSKKFHPDISKEDEKMTQINRAYKVLKNYAENYKFSFSKEEIMKQHPEKRHADKFRF